MVVRRRWWVERWKDMQNAMNEMGRLPVKVPVDAVELKVARFTAS